MPSFETSVTIRRPVEDVFTFLADFENLPRWNYALVKTDKVSEGPVGVGTLYRQTRSLPHSSEESFTVSEYERNRQVSVEGRFGPFQGQLRYRLEPIDEGTRVVNMVDLKAGGVLRLAAAAATPKIKQEVTANLGKLKELLE